MAIVYYDGDCGYCNRVVMWLIHHNIPTRFQFAQLEGQYGENLIKAQPELKNIDTIVVVDKSQVFTKTDAIIHLLNQIKKYKIFALLLKIVPRFLRNLGYDSFAKIRHRIQFKQACKLPTKEERQYFLD